MEDPGWPGFVLSLVAGLAISYYFFRRGRERVRLMYRFRDAALVGAKAGADDPIGILFEDQIVPRVNKAELYLWNGGTRIAKGEDIVSSDPLRVTLPSDERLLRARVLSATRPANSFDVLEQPREALITFDYLDPGDGAVIEILHTASRTDPRLEGTLRGLPGGAEEAPIKALRRRGVNQLAVALMAFSLFWVFLAASADDRPAPEDFQVQQIIDSLPPDDREQMVDYLTDSEALPLEESIPDQYVFLAIGAIVLLWGFGLQVSSSSGKRLPKGLAGNIASGGEEKE